VVIAIIAILAALLLPALARAKKEGQGISCLSNMRQLETAAILYAGDNREYFPENEGHSGTAPIGISPSLPDWVAGSFATLREDPNGQGDDPAGAATNVFLLGTQGSVSGDGSTILVGSIGNYAKNAMTYRCPADQTIDPLYKTTRVRSCSVNCYVGTSSTEALIRGEIVPGYAVFDKTTDFGARMGGANCITFADENPMSLNDGFLLIDEPGGLGDTPAVNHGNCSSLTFADGHAELHPWHDSILNGGTDTGNNTDGFWLAAHCSYKWAANP
jgi:type II secretory pathway pseudopilin PulG